MRKMCCAHSILLCYIIQKNAVLNVVWRVQPLRGKTGGSGDSNAPVWYSYFPQIQGEHMKCVLVNVLHAEGKKGSDLTQH